jgi:hypothetical protein
MVGWSRGQHDPRQCRVPPGARREILTAPQRPYCGGRRIHGSTTRNGSGFHGRDSGDRASRGPRTSPWRPCTRRRTSGAYVGGREGERPGNRFAGKGLHYRGQRHEFCQRALLPWESNRLNIKSLENGKEVELGKQHCCLGRRVVSCGESNLGPLREKEDGSGRAHRGWVTNAGGNKTYLWRRVCQCPCVASCSSCFRDRHRSRVRS